MKLWKRLMHGGCSHRFSWPRVDSDGRHYQICLDCGSAYEYDWKVMRRTRRILITAIEAGPTAPLAPLPRRP